MRFGDLFKLSTRMFKARTSRTLLTILGMGIGISAILFLVSFGYGLQKTLLEKITTSDSLLTLDVSESKEGLNSLDANMLKKIEAMEGVSEVSPAFYLVARGKNGNLSADLSAAVIAPAYLRLGGYKIKKGKTLNEEEPKNVLITSGIARVFGKKEAEEMVGEEIELTFFVSEEKNPFKEAKSLGYASGKFKISGVMDGEDNIVYVNSGVFDGLVVDKFAQVKVKCSSQAFMPLVRENILKQELLVSSLSDTVDQANKIFRIVQIVLMLFGFIALVVSAIGMFNTMTIALLERTEEIGIMKSIGASDRAISTMFIMEATIMGFLGGLGGVAIGLLESELVNWLVNLIATRFGGEAVRLFYSPPWFVLTIIIFAAFVGLVTGFVPARRASKIDPLDALRYK